MKKRKCFCLASFLPLASVDDFPFLFLFCTRASETRAKHNLNQSCWRKASWQKKNFQFNNNPIVVVLAVGENLFLRSFGKKAFSPHILLSSAERDLVPQINSYIHSKAVIALFLLTGYLDLLSSLLFTRLLMKKDNKKIELPPGFSARSIRLAMLSQLRKQLFLIPPLHAML